MYVCICNVFFYQIGIAPSATAKCNGKCNFYNLPPIQDIDGCPNIVAMSFCYFYKTQIIGPSPEHEQRNLAEDRITAQNISVFTAFYLCGRQVYNCTMSTSEREPLSVESCSWSGGAKELNGWRQHGVRTHTAPIKGLRRECQLCKPYGICRRCITL